MRNTMEDDLDALSRPTLTRRKDFIDKEEEARKSPNRVLYFRRNADYDRLIEACGRKLRDNPRNIRALLIRASTCLKKGARHATACCSTCLCCGEAAGGARRAEMAGIACAAIPARCDPANILLLASQQQPGRARPQNARVLSCDGHAVGVPELLHRGLQRPPAWLAGSGGVKRAATAACCRRPAAIAGGLWRSPDHRAPKRRCPLLARHGVREAGRPG